MYTYDITHMCMTYLNNNTNTKDFAKQRYNTPYACNVI